MTRLACSLILAAVIASPGVSLAETYTGTVTGPNSGTANYSGECLPQESGGILCTRKTLLTGPAGKTATRDMERLWTMDKVTTKIVTTGEGGGSVTTLRERLR